MTGYLTGRGQTDGRYFRLAIPNREIRNIFMEQIMAMFKKNVAEDGETLRAFCDALKNGDAEETERLFTAYLSRTVSIRDTFSRKPLKENFYHGILLGILGFKNGWYVKSNRESGDGYSDILIRIDDENIGIIIEVKYADRAKLDEEAVKALAQIESTGYTSELMEDGCFPVYRYGIACYKKKCKVIVNGDV